MFWLIILALPILYSINSVASLLHNRSLARKTNLPYIIWPVYEANLLYLALWGTRWVPYIVNHWLPESIADHINDSVFRARWDVRDRMAKRYGGVYLYVTPGGISCNIADAGMVEQVCKARHNFVKPVKHLEAFDMFGPSIFTTEGSQWAQHHRATAPAFNDKNNALVWTESIRQAREMTQWWSERYSDDDSTRSSFTLPDAREDILKLSLNVICSAGFGVKLPFKPAPEGKTDTTSEGLFRDAVTPPPGYRFTFRGVMEYMNRSMMTVFIANGILPKWIPHSALPFFKKDYDAHRDLGEFLNALIRNVEGSDAETHNLLERLVRSRREQQNNSTKGNAGLTDAEIHGNVYIFSIAGHETTATTLRFALALLALHSDVQEELHQELRSVLDYEPADPADWDYATVYPRLISPLCIMLEILRLYSPVVSIPKFTASSGADLTYNGETHHLPPNVRVNLNGSALHHARRYWGSDPSHFDPWRWDKRNANSFLAQNDGLEGLSGPGLESHDIHRPVRGAYIPFSDGMRACIGKKFAQVEFVAVIAFICYRYRISPGKRHGQSDSDARQVIERALCGSSISLTLAITDKVPLTFQRRDIA